MEADVQQVISIITRMEGVESLMLAGSRTNGTVDAGSDYDLYCYTDRVIPVEERRIRFLPLCRIAEINNTFWETEDDLILSSGIQVEIIYRSLNDLNHHLENLLFQKNASVGYSTCMWANLLHSKILFDPQGRGAALQRKFTMEYPEELKQAIVAKNYPLLVKQMPAYTSQVEKAIGRGDWISVHHRTTAFLESYFDILFAVLEIPHPGEKKILRFLQNSGKSLPLQMEEDLEQMLDGSPQERGVVLRAITARLTQWLEKNKIPIA